MGFLKIMGFRRYLRYLAEETIHDHANDGTQIKLIKNKMDLNIQKIKNYPPPPIYCTLNSFRWQCTDHKIYFKENDN